jgi:hypothetical protein
MAAMEADPMAEEEASEEGDDDEAAAAGAPAKKVKVTDVPVELTPGDLSGPDPLIWFVESRRKFRRLLSYLL